MYKATISITLRPSILDPEGKTVHHALTNLGYTQVDEVRMGKRAELTIDTGDGLGDRRFGGWPDLACDTIDDGTTRRRGQSRGGVLFLITHDA